MVEISVIIPTYNRKHQLEQCLISLLNQTYKGTYEIILVDDGSTDSTIDYLKTLKNKKIRVYSQKKKGPAAARNLGIRHSKGKIIAFTDDDSILDKDWLKNIAKSHKMNKAGIIGGKISIDKNNVYALVSQFLSDTSIIQENNFIFFPTCNISLKKNVFGQIGFFDEEFPLAAGEDLEFGWRAVKKKIDMKFNDKSVVMHNVKNKIMHYLRQAYRYGRGNYIAKLKHPDHPKLQSIKTDKTIKFYLGCLLQIINSPRFAYLFSKRLINSYPGLKLLKK